MKKNKCNLSAVESPTILKRSRVRREYTSALRQETVKQTIGDILPGCEIYGFTKGQFSLIDVLEHLLNQTGPADLLIATWSAAAADIKAAHRFLGDGRIRDLRLLVDYSFQSRKPDFCRELVETFGADAIRVTVTHAKYALLSNESWNLVIRTSMNLNWNPRFENFEISDSKEFMDFQQAIIKEIWESQDVGEGFRVWPQDNKDKFKEAFNRQTSVFNKGMTDGRDLI